MSSLPSVTLSLSLDVSVELWGVPSRRSGLLAVLTLQLEHALLSMQRPLNHLSVPGYYSHRLPSSHRMTREYTFQWISLFFVSLVHIIWREGARCKHPTTSLSMDFFFFLRDQKSVGATSYNQLFVIFIVLLLCLWNRKKKSSYQHDKHEKKKKKEWQQNKPFSFFLWAPQIQLWGCW